jgi:hypothetical protein
MKHTFVTLAAAMALPLGLAGCFTSEQPLLAVEAADFPFEKIVIADEGGSRSTLQRTPEGYRFVGGEEEAGLVMLLDDLGDSIYLVQLTGETEEGPEILFGVVQGDAAAGTARLYMSVADEAEIGPDSGFNFCEPGVVCLTDAAGYIEKAKGMIAGGIEPDNQFTIISME